MDQFPYSSAKTLGIKPGKSLEAERKSTKDNFGYDTATLESLLFDLWAYKIGYLLDHKGDIDEAIDAWGITFGRAVNMCKYCTSQE